MQLTKEDSKKQGTDTIMPTTTTIAKAPHDYWPDDSGGIVKDDFKQYSTLDFKNVGVKCACSKTIHHNKASFGAKHCKTQIHKTWLNKVSKEMPGIRKDAIETRAALRESKIREGKTRQENIRLKADVNRLRDKIFTMEGKIEELGAESKDWGEFYNTQEREKLSQAEEFNERRKQWEEQLYQIDQKLSQTEQQLSLQKGHTGELKQSQIKIQKMEKLWQQMGRHLEYDISDSEEE